MTQEEILKNNILIATFDDPTWKERVDLTWEDIEEYIPSYDKFWDYLFPVLERIETLGYKWEIGMSMSKPYHYCKIWSIGKIEGVSPLDAVYGAVIEFITWFNNNKL